MMISFSSSICFVHIRAGFSWVRMHVTNRTAHCHMVCTGDGKSYELTLEVQSYSISEDWLMGVSYVEHKYSAPFHSKTPMYSVNGQALNYVSTVEDRDKTQPFQTLPWLVEFKGCCRLHEGKTSLTPRPDEVINFNIKATVDLSNHIASPRLVSMPMLFVYPQRLTKMSICALSAGGPKAMRRMNGGTLNYPDDDNTRAVFTWNVTGYSASIIENPSEEKSKNQRCTVLMLGQNPTYMPDDVDYVSISVTMGDALVTGDYAIRAKGPPLIDNQENTRSPFGCPIDDICEGEISLGKKTPLFSGSPTVIDFMSKTGEPLETRYIVSTSTHQSTLLATSNQTVQYSTTAIGLDHAGLPQGAQFGAVLTEGTGGTLITNLDVVFGADEENTRPNVDRFISNAQRDYTSQESKGPEWQIVQNSNFNHGTGGAHISIFVERAKLRSEDITDHRHMAAITGIELANPSQVKGLRDEGYSMLDKNLLEQSDRGEIYLMYKKGSGRPVKSVSTTSCQGCTMISAETSHAQGSAASVTLYIEYSKEIRASRSLIWSPCTGQDEEVILCATANAWNSSFTNVDQFGTVMQCVLLDVVEPRPPKFRYEVGKDNSTIYKAVMGKELEIPLHFERDDLPLTSKEQVPTISFGELALKCDMKECRSPNGDGGHDCWVDVSDEEEERSCSSSDMSAILTGRVRTEDEKTMEEYKCCYTRTSEPKDKDQVPSLLTGRTKTGSRVTGQDKMGSTLSPINTASDGTSKGESRGYLLWTPSPYQGGWTGKICLDACIDTTACPAYQGGPKQVCSQTCFMVEVDRCKWALQKEDSFVEIAPRFQTNWLQLWFLNPMIGHPDHASLLSYNDDAEANDDDVVNIGRIYVPRWDDTMATLAERFGMSVQRLVDLNADLLDISESEFVNQDQDRGVCIIPDSCSLESPKNAGKNM